MIEALLLALQQDPATLVSGVIENGRVTHAAYGLGTGGIGKPILDRSGLQPGQALTSGGVLVRAQAEGVKIDFPSGAEILITPAARVELRDGARTLPSFRGVTLVLADGARVVAIPSAGLRDPLEHVSVEEADNTTVLWRSRTRIADATFARRTTGLELLACGDGASLYQAKWRGPLVELERVLAPREQRDALPARKIVVLGDVLAESLNELPSLVPKRTSDFPEAHEIARELARVRKTLFPRGEIPRVGLGELVFPLAGEFRLAVGKLDQKPLLLTLQRGSTLIPYAEWSLGPRTFLHMTRPDGTHFRREIDISAALPKR